MKQVGSYEAKTHLPALLNVVERGEAVLITRRGIPVALLTQPPQQTNRDVRGVPLQMKELRRGNSLGRGLTVRDLIEEGRRF